MKKIFTIVMLTLCFSLFGADSITGLWKTVDDTTGDPTSFAVIYEYQNKAYGRILVTYNEGKLQDTIMNPKEKAPNIEGEPYYSGLDFIWNMKEGRKKWHGGKIIDPFPADIYGCEMWRDGNNLIVRGKIGPFGRNQTWLPADESDMPEGVVVPATMKPVIPVKK